MSKSVHNIGAFIVSSATMADDRLGHRILGPSLPSFAGHNPDRWLAQANRYFEFYSISDSDRLAISSFHLDDTVSDWFDWVQRNHQVTDWDSFTVALCKRYGSSELLAPTDVSAYISTDSGSIKCVSEVLPSQSIVVEPLIPNLSTPSIYNFNDSDTGDDAGEVDSHANIDSIDGSVCAIVHEDIQFSRTIEGLVASVEVISISTPHLPVVYPLVDPPIITDDCITYGNIGRFATFFDRSVSSFGADWLRRNFSFDPGPAMLFENATNGLLHIAQYLFDEMSSLVHVTKPVQPFVFEGNEDFATRHLPAVYPLIDVANSVETFGLIKLSDQCHVDHGLGSLNSLIPIEDVFFAPVIPVPLATSSNHMLQLKYHLLDIELLVQQLLVRTLLEIRCLHFELDGSIINVEALEFPNPIAPNMGCSAMILGTDSVVPTVRPSIAMSGLDMSVAYDISTGSIFGAEVVVTLGTWVHKHLGLPLTILISVAACYYQYMGDYTYLRANLEDHPTSTHPVMLEFQIRDKRLCWKGGTMDCISYMEEPLQSLSAMLDNMGFSSIISSDFFIYDLGTLRNWEDVKQIIFTMDSKMIIPDMHIFHITIDDIIQHHIFIFSSLLNGHYKSSKVDLAWIVFGALIHLQWAPTVLTSNTILCGLIEAASFLDALNIYEHMVIVYVLWISLDHISGSLILFHKRALRVFHKYRHKWKHKLDGSTVGDSHEHLQVVSVKAPYCYYPHGAFHPNFQRHSYLLLVFGVAHIAHVHFRTTTMSRMCLLVSFNNPYFEWLHWPQASLPFSKIKVAYVLLVCNKSNASEQETKVATSYSWSRSEQLAKIIMLFLCEPKVLTTHILARRCSVVGSSQASLTRMHSNTILHRLVAMITGNVSGSEVTWDHRDVDEPDCVSLCVFITSYSAHGYGADIPQLFSEMQATGLSYAGLLGFGLHHSLRRANGIVPTLHHYGLFLEAAHLLNQIHWKLDLNNSGALLQQACHLLTWYTMLIDMGMHGHNSAALLFVYRLPRRVPLVTLAPLTTSHGQLLEAYAYMPSFTFASFLDLAIISFAALYGHKPPDIICYHSPSCATTGMDIFSRSHCVLDVHLEDKVNLKGGVMLCMTQLVVAKAQVDSPTQNTGIQQ